MIVTQMDDDSEVIDLASTLENYGDFLRIQAEALHGGGNFIVTHREIGRVYLFMHFDSRYSCVIVDYDPGELKVAFTLVNYIIFRMVQ